MRNLAFVLWATLFPVAISLSDYLEFLIRGGVVKPSSAGNDQFAAGVMLFAWIAVAISLYESKPDGERRFRFGRRAKAKRVGNK